MGIYWDIFIYVWNPCLRGNHRGIHLESPLWLPKGSVKNVKRTQRAAWLMAALIFVVCLMIVGPVMAVTLITGPIDISKPGTYRLAEDVIDYSGTGAGATFIRIHCSDVIIDGGGHRLDGVDRAGSVGVGFMFQPNNKENNVTIRNLVLTDWDHGISKEMVTGLNTRIQACTISSSATGIFISMTSDVAVSGCTLAGNSVGVFVAGSNIGIKNSKFIRNSVGIRVTSLGSSTIDSNVFDQNGVGIDSGGYRGVISSNQIKRSTDTGLVVPLNSGTLVYNNNFNNILNVQLTSSYQNNGPNIWSVKRGRGTNIVGGPRIGGNYWATPSGTGFSQVTRDANRDGFCDRSYTIANGNTDYYPLKMVASLP